MNVSSVAGLRAFDLYTSYCISKAALDQFTKCAALALAAKGIRVNSVNPGMIKTPIFKAVGINKSNEDQFYEDHKNDGLVGRVGEVADTSKAIAYLASESFVNGTLLTVDGGFICGTQSNDWYLLFNSTKKNYFKLFFLVFVLVFKTGFSLKWGNEILELVMKCIWNQISVSFMIKWKR